jgi:hypothetical protein
MLKHIEGHGGIVFNEHYADRNQLGRAQNLRRQLLTAIATFLDMLFPIVP